MGKVNIHFVNVTAQVRELRKYTEQNLIIKTENDYQELIGILGEAEGKFKNELITALDQEKKVVLNFAVYIKEICALIEKSSGEFEEVDLQHVDKVHKYFKE
ncbi:MAG: hypothetical protein ACI4DK_04335 [Lachnospiraceae bacterium]